MNDGCSSESNPGMSVVDLLELVFQPAFSDS